MKKEILDQIDNNINYAQTKRIKLNVYVKKVIDGNSNYILIDNDLCIKIDNIERVINFDEIKEIRLSMCSRLYNPGVLEPNMAKWVVKRWQRGAPITVGQHVNYYLDLDIVLENEILEFENNNIYEGAAMIDAIETRGIEINDPMQLKEHLVKYPDPVALVNHLNNYFPKLAKKYDLDNPRGIVYIK